MKKELRIRWVKGARGLAAQWIVPPASRGRLARGIRRDEVYQVYTSYTSRRD
jgi:hypothetical protein